MQLKRITANSIVAATSHFTGFLGIRVILDYWDPSHIEQLSSNWWSATGNFWKIYLFPLNFVPMPPMWQQDRSLIYKLVLASSLSFGLVWSLTLEVRRRKSITWWALILSIPMVLFFAYLALQNLRFGAFGHDYRDLIGWLLIVGPIIGPIAVLALISSRPLTPLHTTLCTLSALWTAISVLANVIIVISALLLWGGIGVIIIRSAILVASLSLISLCVKDIENWRYQLRKFYLFLALILIVVATFNHLKKGTSLVPAGICATVLVGAAIAQSIFIARKQKK